MSQQNLSKSNRSEKKDLALMLISKGEPGKAKAIYKELINLGSKDHIVFCNLAALYGMEGNTSEMVRLLKKSIQLEPKFPDSYNNLAVGLLRQGDVSGAKANLAEAIRLNPHYFDAHLNLGNLFKEQKELARASASFQIAVSICPSRSDLYIEIGNLEKRQGHTINAINNYEKAIHRDPNQPDFHNILGNTLREEGKLEEAIQSYKRALEINPWNAHALNNMGGIMQEKGLIKDAIKYYLQSLSADSNLHQTQSNLAIVLLLSGDYTNGLAKYEYRFSGKKIREILVAEPSCKISNNKVISSQIPILLVAEQGLGDTLQFMRYINELRKQGINARLCAQTKLHPLIKASGIDTSPLTPEEGNALSSGEWMPLLSILRYLDISPGNPIINQAYISTTEDLKKRWKNILKNEKHPIIGINWQGNPSAEVGCLKGRSLRLEKFKLLASTHKGVFLSLQKGFGTEQLETCDFKDQFIKSQHLVNNTLDFLETAAIIENCDLIITSDTSVAHLSGGMGKPTWLLLHNSPDWRWGIEGETTFWYQSMRLFRQSEKDNWNDVMIRVAEELQKSL